MKVMPTMRKPPPAPPKPLTASGVVPLGLAQRRSSPGRWGERGVGGARGRGARPSRRRGVPYALAPMTGAVVKPSRRAASDRRSSRQTNGRVDGRRSAAKNAAASWNASAARRSWGRDRAHAARRDSGRGNDRRRGAQDPRELRAPCAGGERRVGDPLPEDSRGGLPPPVPAPVSARRAHPGRSPRRRWPAGTSVQTNRRHPPTRRRRGRSEARPSPGRGQSEASPREDAHEAVPVPGR